MPLEQYRRKRDFAKTPEPAPARSRGRRCGRAPGARRAVRRPAPSGDPAPLRLPARDRRRPASAGPSRAGRRSTRPSAGWRSTSRTTRSSTSTSRGSSRRSSTGPATSSSGTGGPGNPRRRPRIRPRRSPRASSSSGSTARRSAAGSRSSGPRVARPARAPSRTTRASSGCSSTSAMRRPSTAGTPRIIPASVKTGRTNDEVNAARDAYWIEPGADRRGGDRPVGGASRRADRRRSSSRCSRPCRIGRSTTRTGCSRSSGTATGSRRSWPTARSGSTPGTVIDAATYFPRLLAPPARWLYADDAIIDGEVVALDPNGRAGLLAAPGADLAVDRRTRAGMYGRGARTPEGGAPRRRGRGRRGGRRAARLPGLRPAPARRSVAARGPARGAQATPPGDRHRRLECPLRRAHRRRGVGVLSRRRGAGARGHRRQAPPVALPAGPSDRRLAEDQVTARAGPGRRRLDAGGGEREGARRGRRRGHGRWAAALRREGRLGLRRAGAPAAAATGSMRWRRTSSRSTRRRCRGRTCAASTGSSRELVIRAELGGWSRDGLVRQSAYKGIDDGRDPLTVTRESPIASSVAEAEVGLRVRGESGSVGAPARSDGAARAVGSPDGRSVGDASQRIGPPAPGGRSTERGRRR